MGGANIHNCSFLFELFDFSSFSNVPSLQRYGTKIKTKSSENFVPGLALEWGCELSKQAGVWQAFPLSPFLSHRLQPCLSPGPYTAAQMAFQTGHTREFPAYTGPKARGNLNSHCLAQAFTRDHCAVIGIRGPEMH